VRARSCPSRNRARDVAIATDAVAARTSTGGVCLRGQLYEGDARPRELSSNAVCVARSLALWASRASSRARRARGAAGEASGWLCRSTAEGDDEVGVVAEAVSREANAPVCRLAPARASRRRATPPSSRSAGRRPSTSTQRRTRRREQPKTPALPVAARDAARRKVDPSSSDVGEKVQSERRDRAALAGPVAKGECTAADRASSGIGLEEIVRQGGRPASSLTQERVHRHERTEVRARVPRLAAGEQSGGGAGLDAALALERSQAIRARRRLCTAGLRPAQSKSVPLQPEVTAHGDGPASGPRAAARQHPGRAVPASSVRERLDTRLRASTRHVARCAASLGIARRLAGGEGGLERGLGRAVASASACRSVDRRDRPRRRARLLVGSRAPRRRRAAPDSCSSATQSGPPLVLADGSRETARKGGTAVGEPLEAGVGGRDARPPRPGGGRHPPHPPPPILLGGPVRELALGVLASACESRPRLRELGSKVGRPARAA